MIFILIFPRICLLVFFFAGYTGTSCWSILPEETNAARMERVAHGAAGAVAGTRREGVQKARGGIVPQNGG